MNKDVNIFSDITSDQDILDKLQEYHTELEVQNQELINNQEELMLLAEKYKALYTDAPAAYITVSHSGFIKDCNRRFSEIVNLDKESIIKKPFIQFCDPASQIVFLKHLESASSTEKRQFFEIKLKLAEETVWFNGILNKYIHAPKESLFVLNITNINDLQNLKEKNEIMSFMVDQSHDAIIRTDIRGRILYANDATENMYGYSIDELVGQHPSIFYTNSNSAEIQQAIHKKITTGETYEGNLLNIKKSGEKFWCSMKVTPLYNSEGKPIGFNSIQRDITKLVQAEKEAEAANMAKSEFLGNMSHELRTPLNAIMGFNQLIKDNVKDNVILKYVDNSQMAAENLLSIINDLITFSNIESGKLQPQTESTHIFDILDNIESKFSNTCINKGLSLNFDISNKIPLRIECDPMILYTILENICANAVKFTNKGHIDIGMECTRHDSNNCDLEIIIKDTGIGIKKADLEKLFTPFLQHETPSTKLYGGTGLGLAITRRLTDLLDGDISIKSKANIGTSVHLRIPVKISSMYAGKHYFRDMHILFAGENLFKNESTTAWIESMSESIHMTEKCTDISRILLKNKEINTIITNVPYKEFQTCILNNSYAKIKPRNLNIIFIYQQQAEGDMCAFPEMFIQNISSAPSPVKVLDTLSAVSFHIKKLTPVEKKADTKQFKHALLVEDNILNQIVVQGILKSMDITCEIANHGAEALNSLESNPCSHYDFILMDLYMPVMDGFEAIEKIRKNDTFDKLPIVVVTADSQQTTRKKALSLGAEAFLEKPITKKCLIDVVEMLKNNDAEII